MAESTSNESLTEGAEQSLELFLAQHSEYTSNSSRLSENDVRHVSSLLQYMGKPSWAKVPRLYVVLRLVKHVHVIESFLAQGVSDIWFPFSLKTLPESLRSTSARFEFIQLQDLVLTKAFDLEREDGKHRHFSRADDIPLQKLGELGKGGFGYVDRVLSTVTYKEYARKLIPKGKTFKKNRNVLLDFERELGNLKKLSHIHIVEFIGSYTDPKFVGILMSPVADYNLKDFLTRPTLSSGDLSFLRTFFGCLANAVCYLHEQQIRHKDIKPQNVLVKREQVFLTDFGISLDWSELDNSVTSGVTVKTLRYCAPEVASYRPRDSSSDMWSLGCVFLEMWTVLRGESTTALTKYFLMHGTKSNCYFQNFQAAEEWLERLMNDEHDHEENIPVPWICDLLQQGPEERWTAQTLVQRIQETNKNPDVRYTFTGTCCISSDDWSFSEASSRRSSTMLEETGVSSIEVYDPHPTPPQEKSTSVPTLGYSRPKPSIDRPSLDLGYQQRPLPANEFSGDSIEQRDMHETVSVCSETPPADSSIGSEHGKRSDPSLLIKRKPLAPRNSNNSKRSEILDGAQNEISATSWVNPPKVGDMYASDGPAVIPDSVNPKNMRLEPKSPLFDQSAGQIDIQKLDPSNTEKRILDSSFRDIAMSDNSILRGEFAATIGSENLEIISPEVVIIESLSSAPSPENESVIDSTKTLVSNDFQPLSHIQLQRSLSMPSSRPLRHANVTATDFLSSPEMPQGRSLSTKSARYVEAKSSHTDRIVNRIPSNLSSNGARGNDSKLVKGLDQDTQDPNMRDENRLNHASPKSVTSVLHEEFEPLLQPPSRRLSFEFSEHVNLQLQIVNHDKAKLVIWTEAISSQQSQVQYRQLRSFRDKLKSEKCTLCQRKLVGRSIRALNGLFHEDCFECASCGVHFDPQRHFFPDSDPDNDKEQPFCYACYRLRRTCAECNLPIDDEHPMVSDRRYHPQCLKCSSGSCVLSRNDTWYEEDGKIFCFYHYVTKCSPSCRGCQRPILGQFHTGDLGYWHMECYSVYKVLESLDDRNFQFNGLVNWPTLTRSSLEQVICQLEWSYENTAAWNALAMINSYVDVSTCLVSRAHPRNVTDAQNQSIASWTIREAQDEWMLEMWDLVSLTKITFDILDELKRILAPHRDIQYNDAATLLFEHITSLISHSVKLFEMERQTSTKEQISKLRIDVTNYLTSLFRIALENILYIKDEGVIERAVLVFFYKRGDLIHSLARNMKDTENLRRRARHDSNLIPHGCTFCSEPIVHEHIVLWREFQKRHGWHMWHIEHFVCERCGKSLDKDLDHARFDNWTVRISCDKHAHSTALSASFALAGNGYPLSQLLDMAFAKAVYAIEVLGCKV